MRSDEQINHAIYVATRSPEGKLTGRKAVIKSELKYLRDRYSSLTLLCFEKIDNPELFCDYFVSLKRPPFLRIVFNIFMYFLMSKKSINECLYYNPSNLNFIKKVLEHNSFHVAFFDMIRTAHLRDSIRHKISVIDLDDLLSERYKQYLKRNIPIEETLGYYRSYLPKHLIRFGKLFAKYLLFREISLLCRREIEATSEFDIVSLVSSKECKKFQKIIEKRLNSFPMTFSEGCNLFTKSCRKGYFVFLGGLKFAPNYEGLKWLTKMYQENSELGSSSPIFVIGDYEDEQLSGLDQQHFKYLGYVENIDEIIKHSNGLVAPILSGTGVKTKVVECMSKGIPIITTELGMDGIEYVDGLNCILFNDDKSLLTALSSASEPEYAKKLSSEAFSTYKKHFSESVIFKKWDKVIASIK